MFSALYATTRFAFLCMEGRCVWYGFSAYYMYGVNGRRIVVHSWDSLGGLLVVDEVCNNISLTGDPISAVGLGGTISAIAKAK